MTERSTGGRRRDSVLRAFRRRRSAQACLAYLGLLVLAALMAPWLAPYDPTATDLDQVLSGPTGSHPLGTDNLGRDVLSRLMYGGRVSLVNAAVASVTVLVIGVGTGVTAGFLGGWFDRVFTWTVDVMLAVPVLVTLLVVLAVIGDHQALVMIALGVLVAPGLARVVRAAALSVREELYVAAARVSGLPSRHILVRHILPRVAGPVIVQLSLFAGSALMIDAGLSYLGFGTQPPTPTWGNLIADAAAVTDRQPWLLVPPGIVLGLAILACGLLGDAARDATAERTSSDAAVRRGVVRGPGIPVVSRTEALLSLQNLSVAIPGATGPTTVVAGVDLDIHPGETVGLIGESGCGKSITGRAILGLLPGHGEVVEGRIVFDGRDVVAAGPRILGALRGAEIALISQTPSVSLDPMLRIGNQLEEFVRRHRQMSRSTARARSIALLSDVELPDPDRVAACYPHELSGGMAQRVSIALALAGEPRLLIADEPTTALDVTVQVEVLRLLQRLQQDRGMAILLISHDWKVITSLCHRAYVMYAGHIVESARAAELAAHPLHPYTAALLASAPERATPRRPLPTIPGTVPAPADWPAGCHFAPRCDLATESCSAAPIPVVEPATGRRTRCLRHLELDVPSSGGNRDRAATGHP